MVAQREEALEVINTERYVNTGSNTWVGQNYQKKGLFLGSVSYTRLGRGARDWG